MSQELLEDWSRELEHFPSDKKDIYFAPQYARLYEWDNEKAVCFKFEQDQNLFLFPILRREFIFDQTTYFDFETPYGYGGPISNTDDSQFLSLALKLFFDYCQSHNYVCGFTRFHPILQNSVKFDELGKVLLDRQTVAIDLRPSEDEIWMQSLATKNRSTIKKACTSGLRFEADYNFDYLQNFISLYNNTMAKLGADDFFVFDDAYYKNWVQNITNSFLGVVKFDDRVISAALFFYSEKFGHYHLAGSDPEYLKYNPNNFLIWEASKELKKKGVQYLHIGGGSDGNPENSLLSFKGRFSPLRFEFKIGKLIFNQDIYDKICLKWENKNPEKAIQLKNLLLKYKY